MRHDYKRLTRTVPSLCQNLCHNLLRENGAVYINRALRAVRTGRPVYALPTPPLAALTHWSSAVWDQRSRGSKLQHDWRSVSRLFQTSACNKVALIVAHGRYAWNTSLIIFYPYAYMYSFHIYIYEIIIIYGCAVYGDRCKTMIAQEQTIFSAIWCFSPKILWNW